MNACPDCGSALRRTESGEVAWCRACGPVLPPGAGEDEVLGAALAAWEAELGGGDVEAVDLDGWCARFPALADDLCRTLELARQLYDAAVAPGPPPRLGPYRLEAELGRGGHAPVYRAVDDRSGRAVALKVLLPDALRPAERRRRFLREARALARVRHPNVVPVYDVGEDGPYAWLAMALMDRSLADRAGPDADGAGDLERTLRALRWVAEAADGLAAVHAAGVLHRDVKPSNLLLGPDGRVRVGDFGLAVIEGESRLTRTGAYVGTPGYVAPEHALGPTADVYGLGATLHALLTGEPPAGGRPAPHLPRPVRRVLARSLARRPADRYPDMAAFARDLRRTAERLGRGRAGLAAVAAGLVVAGVLGARWLDGWEPRRAAPAPRAATPAADGWIVWRGDRGAWRPEDPDDPVVARLAAAGLSFDALAGGPGDPRALPVRLPEARYDVTLDGEGMYRRITLRYRAGRVPVGRVVLTESELAGRAGSQPDDWVLGRAVDADGDGLPEVALAAPGDGAPRLALLKWAPQAWGLPELGWRVRAEHRFDFGSPVVADLDGDGRREVLVADAGRDLERGAPGGTSRLYAVGVRDGEIRRRWSLRGTCRSTPRLMRDAAGRVLALFVDLENGQELTQGRRLYRVAADGRLDRLRLPGDPQRWLTWPVFQDVAGDARPELFVGGHGGRLFCLDDRRPDAALWTFTAPAPIESYPVLSPQDADPPREVCFLATGVFYCLEPEVGAPRRVAWSVALAEGEAFRNQPVEVPDLNGDGLPELAVGTQTGRLLVLTGHGGQGRIFAAAEAPGFTHGERAPPPWPFFAARPAVLPRDGHVELVAATVTGWLLGWRVPKGAASPLSLAWSLDLGHAVTATPVVVGAAVLVADAGGWVRLVVPPERGGEPRIAWSYRAAASVGGTPAVYRRDGATWATFTDLAGYIYAVPIRAGLTARDPPSSP